MTYNQKILHSFRFMLLLLLIGLMPLGCSAPHYFWPQKDAEMSEINEPSQEKKILIAARKSEFKNAVVEKIKVAFSDEPVYIKLIGVHELKGEKGENYSSVVIINTCMGWSMDRHVKKFLNRYEDQSKMIILTTSGDGDWMPKMEDYNFDAISSASEKHEVDEVAKSIINKVRMNIQKG